MLGSDLALQLGAEGTRQAAAEAAVAEVHGAATGARMKGFWPRKAKYSGGGVPTVPDEVIHVPDDPEEYRKWLAERARVIAGYRD